ncbi:MAG: hypothetical protein JKY67_16510, partial [Pseudomonadales bacterium]|nr:hypothetical protein [Pseudomonadales bacterium]
MNNIANLIQEKKPKKGKAAKPKTAKEKFQHYWAQIEKLEKSYTTAERKRSELLKQFNRDIRPLEEEHCQSQFDFISTLVSFIDKKSLGKADREVLIEWIGEELEDLMSSPFQVNLDIEKLTDSIFEKNKRINTQQPSKEAPLSRDALADFRDNISEL